jgi:DNA-binding GntR family transcriptional regulator
VKASLLRSEAVYSGLRQAIIEQALVPGDKLPEDAIGKSFGVSRTLVRGALARLEAEGLVRLRANRGAEVASPTLEEAADIFEVRRVLELEAVRRAAMRVQAAGIARLEAHLAEEEAAIGGEAAASIRLAGEFHILLAGLAGSPVLLAFVRELVSRSSLILALYGRPHSPECGAREHRGLVDALRRGDAEAAAGLMAAHLDEVVGRARLGDVARRTHGIGAILERYAG